MHSSELVAGGTSKEGAKRGVLTRGTFNEMSFQGTANDVSLTCESG